MVYLRRTVDHKGETLASYITKTRDKDAALRFKNKELKHHGSPEVITTDGPRSYRAAMNELGNETKQDRTRSIFARFHVDRPSSAKFHYRTDRGNTP